MGATMMRYTYIGNKWTDSRFVGMQCDPVRRSDGKCVVSQKMATALVEDTQGQRCVVYRRALRLNSKLEAVTE